MTNQQRISTHLCIALKHLSANCFVYPTCSFTAVTAVFNKKSSDKSTVHDLLNTKKQADKVRRLADEHSGALSSLKSQIFPVRTG